MRETERFLTPIGRPQEALPGEVLVSSTVKDLVAGSEITFEDRGLHELKEIGEWRLYAVSEHLLSE